MRARRIALVTTTIGLLLTGAVLPAQATAASTGVYVASNLVGWGPDYFGQAEVPASLDGKVVVDVASGEDYSLAVTSDGTVTAWGYDGDGNTDVPPNVSGKDVIAVAAGDFPVALTSDGEVSDWGAHSIAPPSTLSTKSVTAIAAADDEVVALDSTGTVTAWGAFSTVPAALDGVTVVSVAAGVAAVGGTFAVALTSLGKVVVWGSNSLSKVLTQVPPRVASRTVTQISAGVSAIGVLLSNGTVAIWGPRSLVPVPPAPQGNGFIRLVLGYGHALAQRADGTLIPLGADYTIPEQLTGRPLTTVAMGTDGTDFAAVAAVDHLQLTPASRTTPAGVAVPLAAIAYDGFGRSLGTVTLAASYLVVPREGTLLSGAATCTNGQCSSTQPGRYNVIATYTGLDGTATPATAARLTVTDPVVTSVVVTPAPWVYAGTAYQATATAIDSIGTLHDVTKTASWTTGDRSVATVDATGNIGAAAPGTTSLTSTVDGVSGTTPVTVAGPAVEVTSVSPVHPQPGDTVTLTGTGLDRVTSVTRAGQRMSITDSTATALSFVTTSDATRYRLGTSGHGSVLTPAPG